MEPLGSYIDLSFLNETRNVMASDWMDYSTTYKAADLPTAKLDRAMFLRNGLVSLCEGGSFRDEIYQLLRREFISDPVTKSLVPQFVRATHDTSAMWSFFKDFNRSWEPRRKFVREQFGPLIDTLESGARPADNLISETLSSFDAEGVTEAWEKALSRRETDPSGAITAARTMLEAVCKHVLEDDDGNVSYGGSDDLPKLYRLAAERLNIAPSQHSEEAFRRILGGASSVVEGLGSLRNKVGDAHGQGRRPIKPAPRHAGLAVNLAGSMAMFLLETEKARRDDA